MHEYTVVLNLVTFFVAGRRVETIKVSNGRYHDLCGACCGALVFAVRFPWDENFVLYFNFSLQIFSIGIFGQIFLIEIFTQIF
jgi:hypothetical protein